jgi:hypothetical protein
MEKKIYTLADLAFLVVALASVGVYARDTMGKSQSASCDKTNLLGAIVKSSRGDVIGIVNRIENDGGQSFAIINHGPASYYGEEGGYTPVPVAALKNAKHDPNLDNALTVVLNKTEKQLEAAPFWDPIKMDNHRYEAKIDNYYGAKASLCG